MSYYSSKEIRKRQAHYNLIYGERSNGKTFDIIKLGFEDFISSGEVNQLGLIRRHEEDFIGAQSARTVYNSLMCDGNGENQIEKISKGKYTGVEYWGGRYFLTYQKEDKIIKTDKVIAYGFSINNSEHYKSASFPHIRTILFDEFMTRKSYLADEFIMFQNLLSTIIRRRSDVTIFMCANTVNKFCPYFAEMGLYRVKNMRQGEIDTYTYGESGLKVAVEYVSESDKKSKPSNVYFAFNNPRLQMITSGSWEIDIYPHLPIKYRPKDVRFNFFIIFDGDTLHCEVIKRDNNFFIYIHRKTTPIQNENKDLVYTLTPSPKVNYRENLLQYTNEVEKRIVQLFAKKKVFYQDNEVGEIVRNYLNECRK